jgi:hypothetical protein
VKSKKTLRAEYYDTKLSDHRFWIEKGLDVHQAALAVAPFVNQFVHAQRVELGLEAPSETIEPPPRAGIQEVYLLLLGFAECFIKARLTRKLLRGLKGHKFGAEALPKKLKNHNLRQLCNEAGIRLLPREDRVLGILEEAVKWRGRYPVPSLAGDLKATWLSETDLQVAESFVQRLVPRIKRVAAPPSK